MRSVWIGAAVAVVMAALGTPVRSHAQAGAVTHPAWDSGPSAEEYIELYPRIAFEMRISGRALIACRVDERGRLDGCELKGETPKRHSFGDTALLLSRFCRMKPMMVGGRAVGGAVVSLPISFELPPTEPLAIKRTLAPSALDLAREYVAAARVATLLEEEREWAAKALEDPELDVAEPAEAREAAAAMRRAVKETSAELRRVLPAIYASKRTEAQLSAMLRKVRRSKPSEEMDPVAEEVWDVYYERVALRAGDIFCATRTCGARPPHLALVVEDL